MRPRDLLERAQRLASRKSSDYLVGKVVLFNDHLPDDADWSEVWQTVDLKDYPPGPERDALLAKAFHKPGDPTYDDMVCQWAREEEEAKNATA